jgi:hypothetical protein
VKAKTRAVANWIWLIAIVISGVAAIAKEQSSSARIDQTAFVPLGGIDQWISIRGGSRANPVLLVVHGGPDSQHLRGLPRRVISHEVHLTSK